MTSTDCQLRPRVRDAALSGGELLLLGEGRGDGGKGKGKYCPGSAEPHLLAGDFHLGLKGEHCDPSMHPSPRPRGKPMCGEVRQVYLQVCKVSPRQGGGVTREAILGSLPSVVVCGGWLHCVGRALGQEVLPQF